MKPKMTCLETHPDPYARDQFIYAYVYFLNEKKEVVDAKAKRIDFSNQDPNCSAQFIQKKILPRAALLLHSVKSDYYIQGVEFCNNAPQPALYLGRKSGTVNAEEVKSLLQKLFAAENLQEKNQPAKTALFQPEEQKPGHTGSVSRSHRAKLG